MYSNSKPSRNAACYCYSEPQLPLARVVAGGREGVAFVALGYGIENALPGAEGGCCEALVLPRTCPGSVLFVLI